MAPDCFSHHLPPNSTARLQGSGLPGRAPICQKETSSPLFLCCFSWGLARNTCPGPLAPCPPVAHVHSPPGGMCDWTCPRGRGCGSVALSAGCILWILRWSHLMMTDLLPPAHVHDAKMVATLSGWHSHSIWFSMCVWVDKPRCCPLPSQGPPRSCSHTCNNSAIIYVRTTTSEWQRGPGRTSPIPPLQKRRPGLHPQNCDVWLRCDGRRGRHSRNYLNWEEQGKNSWRSAVFHGLLKLCQNTILIIAGAITNLPQTTRLRPETYFSQLWGLDVQDQGPADPVSHELLSSSSHWALT